MLGIMASMDQKDTHAVGWFLSTAPRFWQSPVRCSFRFDSGYMLRQSTAASVVELSVFSAMLGSTLVYGAASLRGHSTGAALGQGCHALIQRRITVEVPQLQFLFKVVNIPVGAQRQLPMVSLFRDH